ncbi:MAG TPA: LysM peptidoglycan-binding domain-containing protein [Anaerolineales bacterium]|nr:LysM peptidoglycan-binding domain-containing protein [Anaerolineales bacterium]
MLKKFSIVCGLLALMAVAWVSPSFAQTATPSITPSITPSLTPTVTGTLSVTPTPTPTITGTLSITPSPTASGTPSLTVTQTASVTPSLTVTLTASVTLTPAVTATPTRYLYTVQRGDTLVTIARKTGVNARLIINANPALIANPNVIYPGMVLVIPNGNASTTTPATPAPSATGATATTAPNTPVSGTYVVQRGDTLAIISRKTGISARAIINANPALMRNPNVIYAGMVLVLPSATITPTNRGPVPQGTATPVPAGATSYKYTVVAGDTLARIVTKTGVDWRRIVAANPWLAANPDRLYPGNVLIIPAPPR